MSFQAKLRQRATDCGFIFYKKALSDVRTVCAYQDGVKIFYGFADKFQLSYDEDGYTAFVYARSSACVLVDNEAYPGQYSCPTSRQLWYIHAKPFGFTFGLPEVFTQSEYIVSKGQSCFGAIDKFMQYACGKGYMLHRRMRCVLLTHPKM